MAPPTVPIAERFEAKYRVDKWTGCWVWTAARMPNGYPQFRYSRAKNGYGHRFAYEWFVGPIPEGAHVDHLCRNRGCVNPAHLEAVAPLENVARCGKRRSRNGEKTHCKRGHLLSGENLYVNPRGGRVCRTCRDAMMAAWWARRREAQLVATPPPH